MTTIPPALKTKGLLVVDDQKFIRGMVAQSLKRFGFDSVVEASDGFDAVQLLGGGDDSSGFKDLLAKRPDIAADVGRKRLTIDCVITDIRMSPMNGLELLKAIRVGVTGKQRDLPVVIMSAHSDEELISAAIALDASAFVVKPVAQGTLTEKVIRALTNPPTLKEREIYAALFVPEVDERHTLLDASTAAAKVQAIRAMDVAALRGQTSINVKLGDLAEGDILTDGITSSTGTVIVPNGTRVTAALINALDDLAALVQLPHTVAVKRKAM
jgi:CheY-like chemotaxis protein